MHILHMVPHQQVWEYYNFLDTTCVPPFHVVRVFATWADVYNHTFKEYLRLRKAGYLDAIAAHMLLRRMMQHKIGNVGA